MLITDQGELGRALEHHISIVWPDAECRVHSPLRAGRLPSAFSAIGYDAVVLDDRCDAGRGELWLANLLHRPDFPPVLYLGPADAELARRVLEQGAIDCLVRERIDHRRFAAVLRDAVQRRRQELALLRTQARAEELARFGNVTILGHRCIRRLASGGTSQVYLAESERAGELVVLKVLRETGDQDGDQERSQALWARFLQEYELISGIRHPNVVRIHDLGIADDHAYLAMEYFARGDLRTRLARRLEPAQALHYLEQMASALEAVHGVGVLHRDLKPGNVMLRNDDSLALIDFGLAKRTDLTIEMTGAGEIFGTPYYMSPEQGHGKPLDARSDLYSLGIVFFEMLTGRKPYQAATPMNVIYLHANAPLPVLQDELAVYQPLLDRLIAKEPEARFGSATELLDAIAALRARHGAA